MSEEGTESSWSKLPLPLQAQFFEIARTRSEVIKKDFESYLQRKKALCELLDLTKIFSSVHPNEEWRKWRIGVVDGSRSPQISQRIGGRFGVCAAVGHIWQNNKIVDPKEDTLFLSMDISDDQIRDRELTDKALELLMTWLERKVACDCLKKGLDLLLIDGSFFGYRVGCKYVADEDIPFEGGQTKKASELIKEINDLTEKLAKSDTPVLGIVKRVTTSALDGYVAFERGSEEQCMNRNDRLILSSIMPEGTVFAYDHLFKPPERHFQYFSLYRGRIRHPPTEETQTREKILEYAKEHFRKRDIEKNLGEGMADVVLSLSRFFQRCSNTIPFCFEMRRDLAFDNGNFRDKFNNITSFFQHPTNNNPATGLPLMIDLIDEEVAIPISFTKEFVQEIHGILSSQVGIDIHDLMNYFSSLNPQKEE